LVHLEKKDPLDFLAIKDFLEFVVFLEKKVTKAHKELLVTKD
jgi:hypothetical protein